MADTGKQSPLGVNTIGSLLKNVGFWINPGAAGFMGASKLTDGDYTFGSVCNSTCLFWLTYAINDAYKRGATRCGAGLTNDDFDTPLPSNNIFVPTYTTSSPPPWATVRINVYNNIVTVGQSRIPALGNSAPPTWITDDPSGVWINLHTDFYSTNLAGAPATSGYGFYSWSEPFFEGEGSPIYGTLTVPKPVYRRQLAYKLEGQNASWYPMLGQVGGTPVPNRAITQWGWVRLIALQAWQDYNYNNETRTNEPPEYRFFCDSFSSFYNFMNYTNDALYSINDSETFLKGTYSNQDDLISADVAGVSNSARAFGMDLILLGNAVDFTYIRTFGLPSTLLQILQNNNALTEPLSMNLMAAGIAQARIQDIATGKTVATKEEEQQIFGAFCVIVGQDLTTIKTILNCRTAGLQSLADLLNVKKMFPSSYTTLTVPIYNLSSTASQSKIYYFLYVGQERNPQLTSPGIVEQVGTIIPPVNPPPPPEPPPPPDPIVVGPPPPAQTYVPPVVTPPATAGTPVTNPVPTQQGGGGCVALESYIPCVETEQTHNDRVINSAWMLEPGMSISLGTDKLEIVNGKVIKALNDVQPCVRIMTIDGISLICSTTAPIYTKEDGYVLAPNLYDKHVAVMQLGTTWYSKVVSVTDMGNRFVRVIDTGDNSFWAGEQEGAYILHHNVAVNDNLQMEKN